MARSVDGPWFWQAKGTWYATVEGKRANLRVKGEGNRGEAVKAWHRVMAGVLPDTPTSPTPVPMPMVNRVTVKQLGDAFLADAEGRMSKACRRNYSLFLDAFTAGVGGRDAESMTDADVVRVSQKPGWSQTYRAGFIGCVLTVYRWGVRAKRIGTNPIGEMKKPAKESRGADAVVSEDDHRKLLAHADPMFADFLRLLWATGARPGELTGITADMVRRLSNGVLPLKDHKTARKGKGRSLILSPTP